MAHYRPIEIRTLESERLVLTPTCLADAPDVQRLFPHLEVLRYMAAVIPWPYPDDGAVSHIATILPKMASREMYSWSIRLKPEGRLIGSIALTPADEEDHRGFWLAQEYWGLGLMREAATLVNDFAFNELEMEYLLLNNAQPNMASHRLKESAGAKVIEVFPDMNFVGGRFPSVRWKLTKEDWLDAKADRA